MSPTKPKKKRQSDGSANTRRRCLNPHFRFLDLPAGEYFKFEILFETSFWLILR
jgi:hypothetical protein